MIASWAELLSNKLHIWPLCRPAVTSSHLGREREREGGMNLIESVGDKSFAAIAASFVSFRLLPSFSTQMMTAGTVITFHEIWAKMCPL